MQQAVVDDQLRHVEATARRLQDAHAKQVADVRFRALRHIPPSAQADARVLRTIGEYHTYALGLQAQLERQHVASAKLELALNVRRDTNNGLRAALADAQAKAAAAEDEVARMRRDGVLLSESPRRTGGSGVLTQGQWKDKVAALDAALKQQMGLVEELRIAADDAKTTAAKATDAAEHWQNVAAVRGAIISKLQVQQQQQQPHGGAHGRSGGRADAAPTNTAPRAQRSPARAGQASGAAKQLPSPMMYDFSPVTPAAGSGATLTEGRHALGPHGDDGAMSVDGSDTVRTPPPPPLAASADASPEELPSAVHASPPSAPRQHPHGPHHPAAAEASTWTSLPPEPAEADSIAVAGPGGDAAEAEGGSAASSVVSTPDASPAPAASSARGGDAGDTVWTALSAELGRLTEHVANHERLMASLNP